MKASATSARNAETSPSEVDHPLVARADSEPADIGSPDSALGGAKKRVRPPAASKAVAPRPDAPAVAVKKPHAPPKPAATKAPVEAALVEAAAIEAAPVEAPPVVAPPVVAPPAEAPAVEAPADPPVPAAEAIAPEPVVAAAEPAAPTPAPEAAVAASEPEETPVVEDNTTPPAEPEDAKPPEAPVAETRSYEPRPMNGMPGTRPVMPVRAMAKQENFVEGDFVVYPTHGVGKVEKIATEDIAGHRLELIHITFEENRMTLRVPVAKARTAGLRKLTSQAKFDEALTVLRGRARIKRTMWSRRAQEYEAKINSGDPVAIAEVVRDLHRNAGQPDQSFSERQIYESAMDRLATEMAALDATDKMTAVVKLATFLKAA